MEFIKTEIAGVALIRLKPIVDERGWFARTFCKREFAEFGVDFDPVQLNQSVNLHRGTFRGLHYQRPPFAEKKLVRCITGRVTDFVLDLRKGSPTFLKTLAFELSAENRQMVLIPEGVAHGFITLADDTALVYQHTEYYRPEVEAGVRFDDPRISLPLPFDITTLSDRDKSYPFLPTEFQGI